MKKSWLNAFKTFFKSKRNLRIIYVILMLLTMYYLLASGFYLIITLILIVAWLMGKEGVEFFNVYNSDEIKRTDISYFTTGDIVNCIRILIIITVLIFALRGLRKMERRIS